MALFENVKNLSLVCGTSGSEADVRDMIIKLLPEKAEYTVDNMGNLLVFVKGKKKPANKVMLAAHMDEVGFIVTYVGANGLLRFTTVGGISPQVLCGKRVIFKNGTVGVFGVTPVHQLKGENKRKYPDTDDMYIDIGAADYDSAAERVSLGDTAVFLSDYSEFGLNKIKGKALDDRAGCAVLLELINGEAEYDMYYAFTVQEEVGARGAAAAAFTVAPDYAIVAEATTAADIAGVDDSKKVCVLGNGPAVSFMDRSTVYLPELYRLAMKIAADNGIKAQTKAYVAGGNDSGAIHRARGGIKTVSVSMPCRYLHSPSCVLDKSDIEECVKLIGKLSGVLANA